MKIVFFGNSSFSVPSLTALLDNFQVKAVVAAPDKKAGRGHKKDAFNPVKSLASEIGIPVLQPAKLKNNQEFYEELQSINADLHVIVSYGKIIPEDMIHIPRYGTINLHASLLPDLRGAAPIQYALWKGYTATGNTVQYISAGMDEGDIIAQSAVAVDPDDDYISLENKLAANGAELLIHSINMIPDAKAIPQNHNDATYTSLISKSDGEISFDMDAESIYNSFRAFKLYPGIYFASSLGNIKITDCALSDIKCSTGSAYRLMSDENKPEASCKYGDILNISADGITVACDNSSILLKGLQAPGKKAVSGADFANRLHNIKNLQEL